MNNGSTIKNGHKEINKLLDLGKLSDALMKFREFQKQFSNDENFKVNEGGMLIDIGGLLKREELIREGINCVEHEIKRMSKHNRILPNLLYDRGNGYHSLSMLKHYHDLNIPLEIDPDIQKAKKSYRFFVTQDFKHPSKEEALIYGCLSSQSLSSDSIDRCMFSFISIPDIIWMFMT